MTTRNVVLSAANAAKTPDSAMSALIAIGNQMSTLGNELIADHATLKTSYDAIETLIEELHDDHATNKTAIDTLQVLVNKLTTELLKDGVVGSEDAGLGTGLAIHGANAENALSANDVAVRYGGATFTVAADSEIDISALTCGGDTITQDDHGCVFVFAKTDGTIDTETTKAAEDYTSLIDAIADYGHSSAISTYLGANEVVCVGAVHVEEDNSGAFTWGTDALSGETANNYYDVVGMGPKVLSSVASLALSAGTSTFDYGAATIVLGTGSRVALTGETGVASEVGSAIADGGVGAWVVYALADNTVISKQLGNAYADNATAVAAVRDMVPNPLLPIIAYFTVQNASGASWTMGTENFDDTDITSTFYTVGPGSDSREIGRAALNQELTCSTDDAAATLGSSKPASGPATLTASTAIDTINTTDVSTPT